MEYPRIWGVFTDLLRATFRKLNLGTLLFCKDKEGHGNNITTSDMCSPRLSPSPLPPPNSTCIAGFWWTEMLSMVCHISAGISHCQETRCWSSLLLPCLLLRHHSLVHRLSNQIHLSHSLALDGLLPALLLAPLLLLYVLHHRVFTYFSCLHLLLVLSISLCAAQTLHFGVE